MRRIVFRLAVLSLVASFAQLSLSAHGQEKMPVRDGPTLIRQKGHADIAYTLSVSKDGKWLVTAGHDGTPTLWETATGRQVRTFDGHRDFINARKNIRGRESLLPATQPCESTEGKLCGYGNRMAAKAWFWVLAETSPLGRKMEAWTVRAQ